MAGMSLSQYLATFTGATAGFEAGLKRAQWDAIGIRAEGPEVELRRLQALYNILRDAHARSPFAAAEARDRLVVLAADVRRPSRACREGRPPRPARARGCWSSR